MAIRTFDSDTYEKIGRPDLNDKMFYINGKTGKKVWGRVTEVSFPRKGVKLKIKPFKKP